MKKPENKIIGYTSGVFDYFHIGYLNILKKAKSKCDIYIVGVTGDELVSFKIKNHSFRLKKELKL